MSLSQRTIRQAGDAYFMALDSLGYQTDIVITCDLKAPVFASTIQAAFKRFIEKNAVLQYVKVRHEAGTWHWGACVTEERPSQVSLKPGPRDSLPGNIDYDALPLRLSVCSDIQLQFRMEHTFANGRASYWWLEQFFKLLSEEVGPGVTELASQQMSRRETIPQSVWQAVLHAFHAARSRNATGCRGRDIRLPVLRAVRTKEVSERVERFVLPLTDIENVMQRDKKKNESYTQALTRKLIENVFFCCPSLPLVGVQITADVHDGCGADYGEIGNFTGLLTGYVDQNQPATVQLDHFFGRIRAGAPLGFTKLLTMFSIGQRGTMRWLRKKFEQVLEQQGDVMLDHLFMVSNLGIVSGIQTKQWLASISLRATTPHIYVSLSCINDLATFEVAYPNNIYDENIVQHILNSFISSWRCA